MECSVKDTDRSLVQMSLDINRVTCLSKTRTDVECRCHWAGIESSDLFVKDTDRC